MVKNNSNESNLKKWIDNILVVNLFIIIIGAFFFLLSIFLSAHGYGKLYGLFQKLWFPIFIPSLSLFFTAILSEAVVTRIQKK